MAYEIKPSKKKKTEEFPYQTGEGSYNRESGQKTLTLVGICITAVVLLAVLSLYLLSRGQVMIK
jgi:hypothetical protein